MAGYHHLITDFGARGDAVTLNTAAIQAVIDAAHGAGGGVVVVPPGRFLTGTIFLRSRVTLELLPGSVILGSPRLEDYPLVGEATGDVTARHLVVARDAHDVTIRGGGTIDGNGPAFWEETVVPPEGGELDRVLASERDPAKAQIAWIPHKANARPSPMIDIGDCLDVRLENIGIVNSAGWNLHTFRCQRVWIHGVKLDANLRGPNNDGFDIDGCRDVMVSDCYLSCCDDAVCLKTERGPCERVTVTNCVIRSRCAAVKLGWGRCFHDFRQIAVSNCVIFESHRGVAVYSGEGAAIEDLVVSNIIFESKLPLVNTLPITIDCRKRYPHTKPGRIRNVSISNFVARTDGRVVITCSPELPRGTVRDIVLRDVQMAYESVENIAAIGRGLKSGQFSQANKDAMAATAAVVVENVENFVLDGLITRWPESNENAAWTPAIKGANGETGFYSRETLYPAQVPAFAAVWARGLTGGMIHVPLATASRKGSAVVDVAESTGIVS